MRRIIFLLLLAIGCYLQGSLIAFSLISWNAEPPAPAVSPTLDSVPQAASDDADQTIQDADLGLAYLRQRESYRALPFLKSALLSDQHNPVLIFALAACYELVGDFQKASQHYERLAYGGASQQMRSRSRLGLIRCLFRSGEVHKAEAILWNGIVNSHAAGEVHENYVDDLYHLGSSLARRLAGKNDDLFFDAKALTSIPDLDFDLIVWQDIQQMTNSEFQAGPQESAPIQERLNSMDTPSCQVEIIVENSVNPELSLVNISSKFHTADRVLEQLCLSLGMEFSVSSQSKIRLESSRFDTNSKLVQTDILLDALTISNQTFWRMVDGRLEIHGPNELESSAIRLFQIGSAERLLQQAMALSPQHESFLSASYDLALIQAAQGEPTLAINRFNSIANATSDANLRQHCYFNLAKLYRSEDQNDLSLQAMQKVIDVTVVGDTLSVCYLMFGQMHLEQGNLEDAVFSFSRAVQAGIDKSMYRQLAAVNLAIAYYLDDKPRLANQTLLEYRGLIRQKELVEFSKLLAALSNYIESNQGIDSSDVRATNLVASLARKFSVEKIGPQARLIKSIGLNELGFYSETIALTDSVSGLSANWLNAYYLRNSVDAMIATRRLDRVESIVNLLEPLSNNHAQHVRLKWANVLLQSGHENKATSICRKVLNGQTNDATKTEALRTLGVISRRAGNHREAALYFSGVAPF